MNPPNPDDFDTIEEYQNYIWLLQEVRRYNQPNLLGQPPQLLYEAVVESASHGANVEFNNLLRSRMRRYRRYQNAEYHASFDLHAVGWRVVLRASAPYQLVFVNMTAPNYMADIQPNYNYCAPAA